MNLFTTISKKKKNKIEVSRLHGNDLNNSGEAIANDIYAAFKDHKEYYFDKIKIEKNNSWFFVIKFINDEFDATNYLSIIKGNVLYKNTIIRFVRDCKLIGKVKDNSLHLESEFFIEKEGITRTNNNNNPRMTNIVNLLKKDLIFNDEFGIKETAKSMDIDNDRINFFVLLFWLFKNVFINRFFSKRAKLKIEPETFASDVSIVANFENFGESISLDEVVYLVDKTIGKMTSVYKQHFQKYNIFVKENIMKIKFFYKPPTKYLLQ